MPGRFASWPQELAARIHRRGRSFVPESPNRESIREYITKILHRGFAGRHGLLKEKKFHRGEFDFQIIPSSSEVDLSKGFVMRLMQVEWVIFSNTPKPFEKVCSFVRSSAF